MEINWIAVGWIIDMILNGLVWFIIVAFSLILIDMTDTWTRKAIQFMDKADKWIRKLIDSLFEWIQKKNLKIISSILLLIVLGSGRSRCLSIICSTNGLIFSKFGFDLFFTLRVISLSDSNFLSFITLKLLF